MSVEYVCPSGLKLRIRGIKGKEMRYLQDRALIKNGTYVDKIFGACVESVVEGGPYPLTGESQTVNWDKVLIGDRYAVLLAIRAETFGQDYEFSVKCNDCQSKFPWGLQLNELPVKKLEPEDAAAFSSNEPMTAVVGGKVFKFKLGTGKDEKASAQHKTIDNALVTMLARKIVEIEGIKPELIRVYLEDLGLADLLKLQKEFQRRDCGIETKIDVVCPDCSAENEVELPLGRAFWLPEEKTA